jgi:hypothetical protein
VSRHRDELDAKLEYVSRHRDVLLEAQRAAEGVRDEIFSFFFLFGFLNFCWCFSPIVRAFVVFASVFVVELHLYITDKLFVIRQ